MNIYGINPVDEALKKQAAGISRIYVRRGKSGARLQKIIDSARTQGVPLCFESASVLRRKAGTDRHQNVVAEVAEVAYVELEVVLEQRPNLLVLVDGVEDPHNLGAVLRTAEAAGVQAVLLPERHSCSLTPTVVKASAGAVLHLPVVRVRNVVQVLEEVKNRGFWVVGLDRAGRHTTADLDLTLPLLVVVGGESRGVRRLVREHCDIEVALPLLGKVSSLNLSVAAGILLYQIVLARQQGKEGKEKGEGRGTKAEVEGRTRKDEVEEG